MIRSITRRLTKHIFQRGQSGQSIIILAMGFVALLGFVGIVTDVSLMFVRYTQLRRAVDAAAIAAAGQMRQDRNFATVNLAARQFIQFHGLDPVDVIVETCNAGPDINGDDVRNELDDPELCPPGNEQRKLVRVTAQVVSETVFMGLLGWDDITLEASAISETAVLDVVLIMDVSESMLDETSYADWAEIGLGTVFRPPSTDQMAKTLASPDTYKTTHLIDLWQNALLNTSQEVVNRRLYFADELTLNDPTADTLYTVRSFDYPGTTNQGVPRVACTVRFAPASMYYDVGDELLGIYNSKGYAWPNAIILPAEEGKWHGFRPTYDFYGCCNDPTTGIGVNLDGTYNFDLYTGDNTDDGDFSDLVCQPFKQARDATRLFLQRLDFTRGDRVAFVTFGRSAYILNPWNVTARTGGRSFMIDSFQEAVDTLNQFVGVRAEPNFYDWDEELDTPGTAGYAGWAGYANGVADANFTAKAAADGSTLQVAPGDSIPIDYGRMTADTSQYPVDPINLNAYPVRDHCPFHNVTMKYPFTRYGRSTEYGFAPLTRYMIPNSSDSGWGTFGLDQLDSYEHWGACRDTNIGGALREANNSLLDDRYGRKEGAVWVMIMLSDGAAGASDPVRRNGATPTTAEPFAPYGTTSDWGTPGDYGSYGVCPYGTSAAPGELVANSEEGEPKFPYCSDEKPETRHFCNFRPEQNRRKDPVKWVEGVDRPIDLGGGFVNSSLDIRTDNDYVTFPTEVQNLAPFDVVDYPAYDIYDLNNDGRVDYEFNENASAGHVYDIDIGVWSTDTTCQYYDVDDYARDWADFVGLLVKGQTSSEALLPTIFTIGFGLNFAEGATGTPGTAGYIPGDPYDLLNIPDYLGEELLRYIADVGDNYKVDIDYQQDYLDHTPPSATLDLEIKNDSEGFGDRGVCEGDAGAMSAPGIYASEDEMINPLPPTQSCGNYFNAPGQEELQLVFDEIASRMFTRLAG